MTGEQAMVSSCGVEITSAQYAEIQQAEAVVIRERETQDGQRWASVIFIGTMAECQDVADTPHLFVVPSTVKCIRDVATPVADLLPPKTEEAATAAGK